MTLGLHYQFYNKCLQLLCCSSVVWSEYFMLINMSVCVKLGLFKCCLMGFDPYIYICLYYRRISDDIYIN
ncbi:TPA_asm: P4 [Passiflora betacytorhabdovirus 1]|nr:TPA_asm: P4 [Passiflora betacytorhabdovirus 1]